jgi:hypothetical protein
VTSVDEPENRAVSGARHMDDAVLDRIRDELELNDGLSGEQLVAAARQSLHLEGPVVDVASQVREVCEELGFLPEDVPNATATLSVAAPPVDDAQRAAATDPEEGVPPGDGRATGHRHEASTAAAAAAAAADAAGASPPPYLDALDLLEDPRQLYARAAASPNRLRPQVGWRRQLLAQLALRNEFQGDRLHKAFIGLVSLLLLHCAGPYRPCGVLEV